MPLTRIAQGAVAAATAALFLLPASAVASAPSDELPPNASLQDAVPQGTGSAEEAAPCRDLRQIGKTTYLRRGGMTAASVKHFYSPGCKRDYGYIWIWKGFSDKYPKYRACIGMWDATDGKLLGNHCRGVRELYSYPVANKPGHHLEPRGSVTVPRSASAGATHN